MSESQWDESAIEAAKTIRSIADDIASEQGCKYTISQQVIQDTITKHFADLRATYDLLLELVKMQNAQRIHRESFMPFQNHVDSNKHKTGVAINARLADLYANPLVQVAIERSRG